MKKPVRKHTAKTPKAKPFCPVFGRCGGCSLQNLTYQEQLDVKTLKVRDAIAKYLSGEFELFPALGMAEPLFYRNKVQYPAGISNRKKVIGFYADHSWDIIENEGCAIQHPEADSIKKILVEHLEANRISVYDRRTEAGYFRYLMTRKAFATGEIMVILVARGPAFPGSKKLIAQILKEVPAVKSIVLNINKRPGPVILGKEEVLLYGDPTIRDILCGLTFDISARSFYQVNPVQTAALYRVAEEFAGITKRHTVFDLYCGIGTFSLIAARKAGTVYGIELNEEAIHDAERNRERNEVPNAKFIAGRAENAIWKLFREGVRPDVAILNPPRSGCDEGVMRALIQRDIPRVVYISCDPETLGRDLGMLEDGGFAIKKIQPVDMFPHTAHIESVALAERKTRR